MNSAFCNLETFKSREKQQLLATSKQQKVQMRVKCIVLYGKSTKPKIQFLTLLNKQQLELL